MLTCADSVLGSADLSCLLHGNWMQIFWQPLGNGLLVHLPHQHHSTVYKILLRRLHQKENDSADSGMSRLLVLINIKKQNVYKRPDRHILLIPHNVQSLQTQLWRTWFRNIKYLEGWHEFRIKETISLKSTATTINQGIYLCITDVVCVFVTDTVVYRPHNWRSVCVCDWYSCLPPT